jgi:hypothetical protein
MKGMGMGIITLYATDDLKRRLIKAFGEGRVSANVERILRHHLADTNEEKKMRLADLNKEIAHFNADYKMFGHLIFEEKEVVGP